MDLLTRFSFARHPIRGGMVQLGQAWQEIRALQEDDAAHALLGEAVAAAPLLGSNIKHDGRLSIQLTGGQDVSMLLADASAGGALRGLVTSQSEATDLAGAAKGGSLCIAIEQASGERFQGLVGVTSPRLAECLEHYFLQSEQLPTRIWLHANEHFAGGLMLQKMPGEADDSDAWTRLTTLAETLHAGELESLSATEILHRLFHEEGAQLHGQADLHFACQCNSDRVEAMLRGLGEEELAQNDQESIVVKCGFCNRAYEYDPVDLLAALRGASDTPATRQ